MTPEDKIFALLLTFPSLRWRAALELSKWNALRFDTWAADSGLSHGERVTAQFVLAVWDPNHDWRCGRFSVMEALRLWDDGNRAAFLAWAADPWWA